MGCQARECQGDRSVDGLKCHGSATGRQKAKPKRPIAQKRKGGIRITARVASCAKSLRKHNNKENIIGLAQTLGIATVRRFHHGDGKRMMSRHSLQRIAEMLAEKLTGEK